MRHVFRIADFDNAEEARALAEKAKKYLEAREDVTAQPTMLVKNGRVSVVGVPQRIADELRVWCAEERKSSG